MDIAASEWSAGCESGWTGYLDESYISRHYNNGVVDDHPHSYTMNLTRNYDDDDMSMVSDASSGPPQHVVQEYDAQSYSRSTINRDNCYSTTSEKSSKKFVKKSKKSSKETKTQGNNKHQQYQQSCYLDDTASSPTITHSKMYDIPSTLDFSQSMSATYPQGNSSYSNHYDFWQTSHPKDTDHSAQPGELQGRVWE